MDFFRCSFVYPEQMVMANTYIKYDDIEKTNDIRSISGLKMLPESNGARPRRDAGADVVHVRQRSLA